jgi:hypothetical protein
MPTFKILGTDGHQYGPVSSDVLRQWISQKRATAATSVQGEGDPEWKPLSSFPEFADVLAAAPPALPIPPPSGPVRTSGLAIASLVCGILGFLCLPALAGVVLGIMALLAIGKSRGQLRGQGLAIAGICLSGLLVLIAVPAALLLPALSAAKGNATRIKCVSNLKQIGLGARIYSNDHDDVFPPDFLSMKDELVSTKILVCPADKKHSTAPTWAAFDARENLTYEYLKPGIAESNAMNEVIFRCPIHGNVCLGDGFVQQRPPGSAIGPRRAPR